MQLGSALILPEHAIIACTTESISLCTKENSITYVNGTECRAGSWMPLQHGDRIIFGNSHFFRINVPRTDDLPSKQLRMEDVKDFKFAKDELERVQTARIEAEIEAENRVKMDALQKARDEAEARLHQQRALFESKLQSLAAEQESRLAREREQAEAVVLEAQREERDKAKAELEQEKKAFQEEMLRSQARMEAEQETARRMLEDQTEQKNKVISQLEDEKKKIEQEVQALKSSTEKRKRIRSDLDASAGVLGLRDGVSANQRLRISATINEANAIASTLKKNTTFRRLEGAGDEAHDLVKITNTKLNITTTWSLAKLESRVEQMREIYNMANDGLPYDEADADALFYDPNDDWTQDNEVPLTPMRSQIARNQFLNRRHTTYDLNDTDSSVADMSMVMKAAEAESKRAEPLSTVELLSGAKRRISTVPESISSSQSLLRGARPETKQTSVAFLCSEYLKNSLGALKSFKTEKAKSLTDDLIETIAALKFAVNAIAKQFDSFAALRNPAATSFVERSDIRNATLSATMSTQSLCSLVQSMRRETGGAATQDLNARLAEAVSSTASNLVKLLKGIEQGIANMVHGAVEAILQNTKDISTLAGELAIATHPVQSQAEESENEDFDEEERHRNEDSQHVMSRMVAVLPSGDQAFSEEPESTSQIDDEILLAFERGTHIHVEKAIASYAKDLAQKCEDVLSYKKKLGSRSSLTAPILDETSSVLSQSAAVLDLSHRLHMILIERSSDSDSKAAAKSFYRKNFTRAKGCINEVCEVADAASQLSDTCHKASLGDADIEQVMSHSGNLRAAISQLKSSVTVKIGQPTHSHIQLFEGLDTAISGFFKVSSELGHLCEKYAGSDQAATRRSSFRGGGLTRQPSVNVTAHGRQSVGNIPKVGSPGSVRRKTLILDQQASVFRLQKELEAAQKELGSLKQANYHENEATSYI
eukprot:m.876191 g.876191  ORF g.876191 m.876191 type:complete len:941 (-) comp59819_c0_seq1:104-2926(-)